MTTPYDIRVTTAYSPARYIIDFGEKHYEVPMSPHPSEIAEGFEGVMRELLKESDDE